MSSFCLVLLGLLVGVARAGAPPDAATVQAQAAWATQQRAAVSCVTPSAWTDTCSAVAWRGGSCGYSIDVDCTSAAACASLFARIFVPPLAADDPCVLTAGYDADDDACALQLDASCQAKQYHERFTVINGTYYGYTVTAHSGGARAALTWALLLVGVASYK